MLLAMALLLQGHGDAPADASGRPAVQRGVLVAVRLAVSEAAADSAFVGGLQSGRQSERAPIGGLRQSEAMLALILKTKPA